MGRVLKGCLILVVLLLLALCLLGIVGYVLGGNAFDKTYDVEVQALSIPTEESAQERGQYLVEAVLMCQECHGDQLEGDVLIDEAPMGTIYATNLTSGEGGIGSEYSDEDWVRALRHGVGPEGRGLIIMPSHHFAKFSDEDLAAVISYLKTVPPVDNDTPEPNVGIGARLMVLADPEGFLPAEAIDHDAETVASVSPAVSAEYGAYLGEICTACHGEDLGGMSAPGGGGEAPSITSDSNVGDYSLAEFTSIMRTGTKPNGDVLDVEEMPWDRFAQMTDEDLEAIYLHLQAMP